MRQGMLEVVILQGSPENYPLVYYTTLLVTLYLAIFYVFIVDTELLNLDALTSQETHFPPEDENRRRKEGWQCRPRLVQTYEY